MRPRSGATLLRAKHEQALARGTRDIAAVSGSNRTGVAHTSYPAAATPLLERADHRVELTIFEDHVAVSPHPVPIAMAEDPVRHWHIEVESPAEANDATQEPWIDGQQRLEHPEVKRALLIAD